MTVLGRGVAGGALALLVLPGCGGASLEARLVSGERHFGNYCSPCHHPSGSGVERSGPPLAGSAWVRGPASRLARIVLHGLHGAIDVNGRTYSLEMPGFARILDDSQIADVLTFVRDRFGDGSPPLTRQEVGRARSATLDRGRYFTSAELLEVGEEP